MCFSITTCCCCISLEIGAQIISIISLIVALADTAYCVWSAIMLPLVQIKIITAFIIVAIMALFETFCACLLICGVFMKKANFTVPWLVLAWVKSIACLVVAAFGIAVLVLKPDTLHKSEGPAPTPSNSTVDLPTNVTESVDTSAPDVPANTIDKTTIFIVIVAACILQAFLLMYFACVVNSRRKKIRDDDYSQYMPVRTDSIRNVYVPITQQMQARRYGHTS
ncbi:uncharacterized protein LOC113239668 [Hyposmocoma kahamanoa]|uniref:uncharacterized protein LOC113239668 n=1 Tax=Hyposmocoma kahamanoa TaxID=1477025 RepID=UPI000E6D630F|nr:uncharacterized protein LOC113239668 [Hyposmocoma kahamanoa]XP_026332534.1 uncharacterized protein LOC113239668 [Hyposmocoma kahamanoa]